MNASVQRLRRTMPILRSPDDRWFGSGAPSGRLSAMMMVVLVVSLAIHAGLIATALLADRPSRREAPTEIAVEIVHEAPPAPAPPDARRADLPPPPAEPPKPETVAADTKAEPKPRPPQPPQPPKAAQAEPAKPEAPRSAPARPAETAAAKPMPTKPQDGEALAALERELASLRAEQAALAAERDVVAAAPIGPHSFEAIALPSTSETGEATGYESLVFSQLYKAKEAHRHEGRPGTATVVFKVDDAGKLVESAIAVPSGIAALDAEALVLIREAAPFPPPPAGMRHAFSANVSFVVGDHY